MSENQNSLDLKEDDSLSMISVNSETDVSLSSQFPDISLSSVESQTSRFSVLSTQMSVLSIYSTDSDKASDVCTLRSKSLGSDSVVSSKDSTSVVESEGLALSAKSSASTEETQSSSSYTYSSTSLSGWNSSISSAPKSSLIESYSSDSSTETLNRGQESIGSPSFGSSDGEFSFDSEECVK